MIDHLQLGTVAEWAAIAIALIPLYKKTPKDEGAA
jgi:hypothetical protein